MSEGRSHSGWKNPAVLAAAVAGVLGLITAITTTLLTQESGGPAPESPAAFVAEDSAQWPYRSFLFRETFSPGALADRYRQEMGWLEGSDEPGIWEGLTVDGVHRLVNGHKEAEVFYFHLDAGQISPNVPISARVRAEVDPTAGDSESAAGLLYRFDPQTGMYYAFVVSSSGTAELLKRTPESLLTLQGWDLPASHPDGFRNLGIYGEGDVLHLYVDDAWLATVEDVGPAVGIPGIIALFRGVFEFDEVTLYQPDAAP